MRLEVHSKAGRRAAAPETDGKRKEIRGVVARRYPGGSDHQRRKRSTVREGRREQAVLRGDRQILNATQAMQRAFAGARPDVREHADDSQPVRDAVMADHAQAFCRERADIGIAAPDTALPILVPALVSVNDAEVKRLPGHYDTVVYGLSDKAGRGSEQGKQGAKRNGANRFDGSGNRGLGFGGYWVRPDEYRSRTRTGQR
jgi:hypothetical protein